MGMCNTGIWLGCLKQPEKIVPICFTNSQSALKGTDSCGSWGQTFFQWECIPAKRRCLPWGKEESNFQMRQKTRRGELKLRLQHLKFPSRAYQGSRWRGCRSQVYLLPFTWESLDQYVRDVALNLLSLSQKKCGICSSSRDQKGLEVGRNFCRSSCPNLPSKLVLGSWGINLQHGVHSSGCRDLAVASLKRFLPPLQLWKLRRREENNCESYLLCSMSG